jgi:hypothetical protein
MNSAVAAAGARARREAAEHLRDGLVDAHTPVLRARIHSTRTACASPRQVSPRVSGSTESMIGVPNHGSMHELAPPVPVAPFPDDALDLLLRGCVGRHETTRVALRAPKTASLQTRIDRGPGRDCESESRVVGADSINHLFVGSRRTVWRWSRRSRQADRRNLGRLME